MKTRQQIINQVKRKLAEVNQLLADAEHWNSGRGKTEGRIDVDPDGQLQQIKKNYEACLQNEIRICEPNPDKP